MRGKALEYSAMCGVVDHLRFALKVFEAAGCAEFRGHVFHIGRDCSVPLLMPVVISPRITGGPAIGLGDECLEPLERGHAWDSEFDRKPAIDTVIRIERLKLIRTG